MHLIFLNQPGRCFINLNFEILIVILILACSYNTKFGTNAVPMVLIFQQKNVVAKYNHTQKNLTHLVEFLSKNTG